MNRLELLTTQPDFPNEDLSEANVPHVEYYLGERRYEAASAEYFRQSLRMLHITGHQALQICGIEVDYSEKEYVAFCKGFASFEHMSMLVNPRPYDGMLAVANTRELLVESAIAEFEIADHYKAWLTTHPNAYGVVIESGAAQGEGMKQLHARAIGAQLACELQMVA